MAGYDTDRGGWQRLFMHEMDISMYHFETRRTVMV